MKTVYLSMMCMLLAISSQAQDVPELIQQQTDAFNNNDLDKMTAQLHEGFKWYWIKADELVLEVEGKEAFRSAMESYYQSIPTVQSEIVELSVLGNRASFLEKVSYTTDQGKHGESRALGTYEFKDGLIYRVWYYE